MAEGGGTFQVTGYTCRCGHQWVPRMLKAERPRVCPKCKSANWDRPYRRKAVGDDREARG